LSQLLAALRIAIEILQNFLLPDDAPSSAMQPALNAGVKVSGCRRENAPRRGVTMFDVVDALQRCVNARRL
jgi:hypothetical protein